MKEIIRTKLAVLEPSVLDIIDESHKHANHYLPAQSGQTHFKLIIVSERFNLLTKIARHKLIYDLLQVELAQQIHALSIQTYTSREYKF